MTVKTWWKKRSYGFKGGVIGLFIAILSVVSISLIDILPSNFLRLLKPANYTTFRSVFKIILVYNSILTLLGILIGFITGKIKKKMALRKF